jgi:hypothetical protein
MKMRKTVNEFFLAGARIFSFCTRAMRENILQPREEMSIAAREAFIYQLRRVAGLWCAERFSLAM